MTCDLTSEFPFCSDGSCSCTKTRGEFEKGDGTTTGSCTTTLHKCQANGRCTECQFDSQCTGLSNKCIAGKCSCGDLGPCNATRSNICVEEGGTSVCKCGTGDQCPSEIFLEQDTDCGKAGGDFFNSNNKCSYNVFTRECFVTRSPQEVCEKVTEFYNPFFREIYFIEDQNGNEKPLNCDDNIGKNTGEYKCLGI